MTRGDLPICLRREVHVLGSGDARGRQKSAEGIIGQSTWPKARTSDTWLLLISEGKEAEEMISRSTTDQAIPILPSRDLDVTVAFYSSLGFQVVARYDPPDAYLILRRGNIELHFFEWEDVDPWSSIAGCYLRVAEPSEWHEAFSGAELPDEGIPRITDPRTTDYGMREFALIDMDGNLVRVGGRIEA